MTFLRSIVFWAALVFFPLVATAQQQLYVSDVQEITVRSGPTLDSKVVQMVKSGARIDKIKEEGEWAMVRTDSGKEGWVLKRFLSVETPVKVQFDDFKSKNADLIEKAGHVEELIGKYTDENKNLQQSLTQTKDDYAKLKSDYDALTKANANVAELTKNYGELKAASDTARQEIEVLKRRNESLQDLSDVKWFLAGAGVFFGGWIFGYLLGRSARKKANRVYL